MKKFIIALSALILLYLAYDTARYRLGWYIDLKPDEPVTAFMTTDTQSIYMDRGSGPEPFTVKGVNLGVGLPGEWATDYAIDRETYLRWFGQMQEMAPIPYAFTLRCMTIFIMPSMNTTRCARRTARSRSG